MLSADSPAHEGAEGLAVVPVTAESLTKFWCHCGPLVPHVWLWVPCVSWDPRTGSQGPRGSTEWVPNWETHLEWDPEESIVFRNRETNVPEAGGALGFGPHWSEPILPGCWREATPGSWSGPLCVWSDSLCTTAPRQSSLCLIINSKLYPQVLFLGGKLDVS